MKITMKKIIIALSAFFGFAFFVSAQENVSAVSENNAASSEKLVLTVEDAVKIASENNISIKRSKLDLDKLEAADKFSWSSISPSLSASGSYRTPFEENRDSLSLSGTATLGLSTNLYSTMRAAKLNYENGLLTYDQAVRSIELSVRKTFYGLLYEKENIELQKRGLETSRIQYETNQEKFRNGTISELDVMTSRVNYETKKPVVESAEITYENDLASFKQILGIDQKTEITLSGSLDEVLNLKSISFDDLPEANKPAPDVQAAEYALEIAKNTLLASRFSAYGPSLSASFNYGLTNSYSLSEQEKAWEDSKSLSVSVNIPLDGYLPWSAGAVSVKSNKKSVEAAELNLENTRTSVQVQTDNYIRRINQGISQLESLIESEKLAEQAYNMSQTAYNYGRTDILSLQDYSDSLLSARVNVRQQAYSLLSSVLDLEGLLGLPFGTLAK